MFGQEGLRWRMRKNIEDLHLAKCSTLYSAVFNNVHSYILWGLNFVCSPGHKNLTHKNLPYENFYDDGIAIIFWIGLHGVRMPFCCIICEAQVL